MLRFKTLLMFILQHFLANVEPPERRLIWITPFFLRTLQFKKLKGPKGHKYMCTLIPSWKHSLISQFICMNSGWSVLLMELKLLLPRFCTMASIENIARFLKTQVLKQFKPFLFKAKGKDSSSPFLKLLRTSEKIFPSHSVKKIRIIHSEQI